MWLMERILEGGAVATMVQVQCSKYHGGSQALEIVEVAVPEAGRGEVVVRVEASLVNPVDLRIQDGHTKHLLPRRFPFVPGKDVAAEVVALGPGVAGFALGDKVVTYLHVLAARTMARPREVSAVQYAWAVVLVQLVKLAGAHVTATCGAERNRELLRGLGADEVLIYRSPDWRGRFYHILLNCAHFVPPEAFAARLHLGNQIVN